MSRPLPPGIKRFYGDDFYWLVTVDGIARGAFVLAVDALDLYNVTSPDKEDGTVELWRLNGGHLCTPCECFKSPTESAVDAQVHAVTKQIKLMDLADRIDHEQLWRHAGMNRDKLTPMQMDRLNAGVELRRYARLWAPGNWLVFPPVGPTHFSAGTLDKAVEMAKRDEARRSANEQRANARLIAASPDLLTEVEAEYITLADNRNNWPGRDTIAGQQRLCRLRDLICRATGRDAQDVQDDYGNRNLAKAEGRTT